MRIRHSQKRSYPEVALERLARATGTAGGAAGLVREFIARTPNLTSGEQIEFLGLTVESLRAENRAPARTVPAPSQPQQRGSTDWLGGISTGLNLFSQGASAVAQLTQMFANPNDRGAQDFARVFGTMGAVSGGVNSMLQGVSGRQQVPPLPARPSAPGPSPAGAAPSTLAGRPPGVPAPSPAATPRPPAPQPAPTPGGFDATALLSLLMSNPQLQQALQSAPVLGNAGPRSVNLDVPTSGGASQPMNIPLGAVMNTIMQLASRSREEFNAATREDDPEVPEYLVSEQGELIVDPSSAEDRAAAVMYRFRQAREHQRLAATLPADDAESWAYEAGF